MHLESQAKTDLNRNGTVPALSKYWERTLAGDSETHTASTEGTAGPESNPRRQLHPSRLRCSLSPQRALEHCSRSPRFSEQPGLFYTGNSLFSCRSGGGVLALSEGQTLLALHQKSFWSQGTKQRSKTNQDSVVFEQPHFLCPHLLPYKEPFFFPKKYYFK